MKSSISDLHRLEIPKKHFRNTHQCSLQSQVCPLVLTAVHGADTLVSLTAATSSWSLHILGRALVTLPLAVESPFQGCVVWNAYGAVRNLEAVTALTPKGSRLTGMHLWPGLSQKPRCRVFSLTVQWHRSVRVWLQNHLKAGSLLSVPNCITLGKGSTLPWFLVIGHSCPICVGDLGSAGRFVLG